MKKPKKVRRVFVTLEVETTASLAKLRKAKSWTMWGCPDLGVRVFKCLQAQANVARTKK